ncbi:MAG: transcription antitermination factor NusB [Lachnospiraceae bacterium]|nr:transcription antitermination factor NusB [Lachnospiraceae bacterium]MDD7026225.1 transcription antitermination factor NusB [Lachnospiraceae bacterium]MDY5701447.1 transcription antitermination factor NusB [Lachnospiraceae bacterium]
MNRRSLREQVFKILFRVEFNSAEEMEEQCRLFLEYEDMDISEKDGALITERFNAVQDKLDQIDSMINERTRGWTTERMGKVDLAILRLALFEMKFDEAIPEGVAINEAVELAKKFGQEESAGFINGVLAKFADTKQA